MQRGVESGLRHRMSGTSSATRTANTRLAQGQIGPQMLASGRPLDVTSVSEIAIAKLA
jgi:hypothetical protein